MDRHNKKNKDIPVDVILQLKEYKGKYIYKELTIEIFEKVLNKLLDNENKKA